MEQKEGASGNFAVHNFLKHFPMGALISNQKAVK